MKTKTTLNKKDDFFTSPKIRLITLISFSFLKKIASVPYKITFILIFVFSTSILFGQSNCKATLQVEKDRNTSSVPPEGTYYSMVISNPGIITTNYTLSSLNVNSSCTNNDDSSTSGNVNLTVTFVDTSLNPISEISLTPGQTAKFLVNIKIPAGTTVNKWNCTQITASSCSNYNVSTILHTLVSDPNQE